MSIEEQAKEAKAQRDEAVQKMKAAWADFVLMAEMQPEVFLIVVTVVFVFPLWIFLKMLLSVVP